MKYIVSRIYCMYVYVPTRNPTKITRIIILCHFITTAVFYFEIIAIKMNWKIIVIFFASFFQSQDALLGGFLDTDLEVELLRFFSHKRLEFYVEMTSPNCIQFDTHRKSESPREMLFIRKSVKWNLG